MFLWSHAEQEKWIMCETGRSFLSRYIFNKTCPFPKRPWLMYLLPTNVLMYLPESRAWFRSFVARGNIIRVLDQKCRTFNCLNLNLTLNFLFYCVNVFHVSKDVTLTVSDMFQPRSSFPHHFFSPLMRPDIFGVFGNACVMTRISDEPLWV